MLNICTTPEALSIIPKFPVHKEEIITKSYLDEFINHRAMRLIQSSFVKLTENVIQRLEAYKRTVHGTELTRVDLIKEYEVNTQSQSSKDNFYQSKAAKKLEEYLHEFKHWFTTYKHAHLTDIDEKFIKDTIQMECLEALHDIRIVIESTDWEIGKWGSFSQIEVDGSKKKIPKHMKQIYDKILHAERDPNKVSTALSEIHNIASRALADKPSLFSKFRVRSPSTNNAYKEIECQTGNQFGF